MGFSQDLKNGLKDRVKGMDLFKTPVTFTSNNKKQYGSLTAGIVSLLLIIFLAQMLIREAVSLINREKITYEQFRIDGTTTKKLGPPLDKSFIFAIGIDSMDLVNGTQRYFDFEMVFKVEKRVFQDQESQDINDDQYDSSDADSSDYQNQADDNTTNDGNVQMSYINVDALDTSKPKNFLKPCNLTFWEQKGFGRQFNRSKLQQFLCPSEQANFFFVGKSNSKLSTSYEIKITPCTEIPGLAPCAPESQIEFFAYLNDGFLLKFYYIDTIISPGVQKYLTYAFSDAYEWTISRKLLLKAQVCLSQYVIQTDYSYTKDINNYKFDSGVALLEVINYENLPVQTMKDKTYAFFTLQKDPISHRYTRSFGKIDTLIAYIGGILGSLVGLVKIFMSWYNKIEFEVSQMKNLYTFKNNKRFDTRSFNVFRGLIYFILSKLYNADLKEYLPTFQYYEDLHEYLGEGRKNIDIDLIVQKVLLAEKLGMILLSKQQYKALIMSDPFTIEEGKEIREQILLQEDVLKLLQEEEDLPPDFEPENKISNSQDSSIIELANSTQRIDDKLSLEKEVVEKKEKLDPQEQKRLLIKKLGSEAIQIMSKLQEKVDDKNPIAERIMNRINPIIKEKYIQSIVTVTPKKKRSQKMKVKTNLFQEKNRNHEIIQLPQ